MTHVKDMKDLGKVRLPGGNSFLVDLWVKTSNYCISFSLLDGLFLDLPHDPEVR